jgi:NitT/TauT family transport system substrate-binding protein
MLRDLFLTLGGAIVLVAACATPAPLSTSTPAQSREAPAPAAAAKPAASAASAVVPTAAPAAAPSAPPDRQAMKFGYVPFVVLGPMFVALERGYFAEQGIDLEMVVFDSGAQMVAPAAAGQLDAITGILGPGLFNALARGVELKALVPFSYSAGELMARKELVDSGALRTIDDLRGKRVSFHIEGSGADYTMRNFFYMNGLTLQDVDVHRLGNPDIGPALANGAVDLAYGPEPVPTALQQAGIAVPSYPVTETVGQHYSAILVAGPGLLGRGDGPTTRFVTAFVKGLRDFNAGIRDRKVVDPGLRDILSKWTGLSVEMITLASTVPAPEGGLDSTQVSRQHEFWLRETGQGQGVDLTKFVEPKYLDAVLVQLR